MLLAAPLLALVGLSAPGLGRPELSIPAMRIREPLRLDGRLDEGAWRTATPAGDFTAQWPDFGVPSALRTEARVLYDEQYLYVGARLFHPDGRRGVVTRLHRRDQDSASDWFTIYVDSLHDKRTAWGFAVNASGVQRDLLCYGDTRQDTSWDGVWESAVSADEEGWSVEMRIPLSLLRLRPEADTWGINFSRVDQGRIRERSFWYQPPRGVNGFVSQFPTLTGISALAPQPRREWIPYLSTQRKTDTQQGFDDLRWRHRAGLDAHFSINSHAQLDATVMPDFGQVEVDQAVINLTTIETFFPEKRPFFLEGMDLFQFPGTTLFYSRRLGRGIGAAPPPPNTQWVDRPQAAEITGAGKYTAKFGSGLSLGLLAAGVDAARGEVRRADGTIQRVELTPATQASVLRVAQSLDDRGSYLGGMATVFRQAGPTGRRSEVAAMDGAWKSEDRATSVEATLASSRIATPSQKTGQRGTLVFRQVWKNGFDFEWDGFHTTRDFSPNDLGYLSRPDEQRSALYLRQNLDRGAGPFRSLSFNLNHTVAQDQAGRLLDRKITFGFQGNFPNFWGLWGDVSRIGSGNDDRELRTFNDPLKKYLRTPAASSASLSFDTAANKPYYIRLRVARTWYEGGPTSDTSLGQTIKLGEAAELSLETGSTRTEGQRRYVTTPSDGFPVTGLRRMSLFNQTLRVAYAFTPTLTVQAFVQWLGASWTHRDFQAWQPDDRLVATAAPASASGSDRVLNLNAIARWEFRPGSTAFLVYTKGANSSSLLNDQGSLSPRRDLVSMGRLPSDEAVQFKISWLFR